MAYTVAIFSSDGMLIFSARSASFNFSWSSPAAETVAAVDTPEQPESTPQATETEQWAAPCPRFYARAYRGHWKAPSQLRYLRCIRPYSDPKVKPEDEFDDDDDDDDEEETTGWVKLWALSEIKPI